MNFTPYVDDIRHGFVVAADPGGEEGRTSGGKRRIGPDSPAPHADDLAWHHLPSDDLAWQHRPSDDLAWEHHPSDDLAWQDLPSEQPPCAPEPAGIPLGLLCAALTGGYIRLQLSAPGDLDTAAALFDSAVPDHEVLALQVPSDGTVATLRSVLGVLDEAGIRITAITVHTPGLGDVASTFLDPEDRGR
ncbi:hypothetical protein [Streptomyces spectabilis]|uniref:ACT domain-containing protein n=1 Tax=Streptomyces spectabilis TaxID=68270 RepID=A0A7W8B1I0_STRST|nr:hypothetical protein [Streptomyces spectabilis]MBB5106958.1 hypothetical protein [Streptomyces spectabilis]MCI3906312.1 hypothetical protein [Streptomyces spectabilis]